jgi:hypothetical protein
MPPHVVDSNGNAMPMSHSSFAWAIRRVSHRLSPGQTVALGGVSIAFVDSRGPAAPLPSNKAVGSTIYCKPDRYRVWYDVHLGDYDKAFEAATGTKVQRQTGMRRVLLAGPDDEEPEPMRGERIRW